MLVNTDNADDADLAERLQAILEEIYRDPTLSFRGHEEDGQPLHKILEGDTEKFSEKMRGSLSEKMRVCVHGE